MIGDPIDDAFDRNERHRSRQRLAARDPDAGGRAHLRAIVARQGPDGGTVLVALLAPAGMAYAQASGLPPITGPYAMIVPLLVYALVGPSRILVMGPDSSLASLIAAAVIPLSHGDPGRAIAVAGRLSVIVGVIGVLAGLARFGFLAELLSAPVRYGYLNGIALTILVSQLPKALGFSVDAETLLGTLRDLVSRITDGETNRWALGLAGAALAAIVGLRRFVPRVPGVLVAVIAGILATVAFGLVDHGVRLVGDLPSGFPSPRLPDISWQRIGRLTIAALTIAALGIAFIAFADTSVVHGSTRTRNASRSAWSTSQPAFSRECR